MSLATGWFGIPGGPEHRSTKVHVVRDGTPVCGARVGPEMQFQWCAPGTYWPYVDCTRCGRWIEREADTPTGGGKSKGSPR